MLLAAQTLTYFKIYLHFRAQLRLLLHIVSVQTILIKIGQTGQNLHSYFSHEVQLTFRITQIWFGKVMTFLYHQNNKKYRTLHLTCLLSSKAGQALDNSPFLADPPSGALRHPGLKQSSYTWACDQNCKHMFMYMNNWDKGVAPAICLCIFSAGEY